MWWLLIIAVVGFTIYSIAKDYKKDYKENVSNYGGMQSKYHELIDYFTKRESFELKKLTKDHITLGVPSITITIDYIGGSTEIRVILFHPLINSISSKWNYPSGFPQKKIILDIQSFVSNKLKEVESINPQVDKNKKIQKIKDEVGKSLIDKLLDIIADDSMSYGDDQSKSIYIMATIVDISKSSKIKFLMQKEKLGLTEEEINDAVNDAINNYYQKIFES